MSSFNCYNYKGMMIWWLANNAQQNNFDFILPTGKTLEALGNFKTF